MYRNGTWLLVLYIENFYTQNWCAARKLRAATPP